MGDVPNNLLIVNSHTGYPNPISASRFFADASAAADLRRLVSVVLGCTTDGLLHYSEAGTAIVLRHAAQARLWDPIQIDVAALTGLVLPLNRWMQDRAIILKGKRAVDKRLAKSDETLDEFGYPDLRRTLLNLAGRKHKKLQILDAAGHGGILEIPPRGHLIPVQKIKEQLPSDDGEEVLGIEHITQLIDPSGTLVEASTARVSTRVVEGEHAYVRRPHNVSVRSQRAQHLKIMQQRQEQGSETK